MWYLRIEGVKYNAENFEMCPLSSLIVLTLFMMRLRWRLRNKLLSSWSRLYMSTCSYSCFSTFSCTRIGENWVVLAHILTGFESERLVLLQNFVFLLTGKMCTRTGTHNQTKDIISIDSKTLNGVLFSHGVPKYQGRSDDHCSVVLKIYREMNVL